MKIENLLLNILNKFENQSNDFFITVKVSNEKTVIKFGTIDNEQLSLNFFIYGKLDESINDLESKINALFNTDSDTIIIHDILNKINEPAKISFSPFIKISRQDEPLIHAFRLTIKYNQI